MKNCRKSTWKTAAVMRRLLSLLLVLVMVMGYLPLNALASQTDEEDGNPFKDVTTSDWYYAAVDYVYQNKIFNGISDTGFGPSYGMTRAMFVTTLGRFAGIDISKYPGNGGFSDVDPDAYYAPYVSWAVEMGITVGIGGGLFGVDDPVTREQMAVFIVRFMTEYGGSYSSSNPDKAPPRDLDSVSSWARDAVLILWNAGILNGDENQNVNPRASATRAETATIYMNLGKGTDAMGIAQEDSESGLFPGGGEAQSVLQKYDESIQVPEFVAEEPVKESYTVSIKTAVPMTAEQVKQSLRLSATSGVDDRDFIVTGSEDSFTVSMEGGWAPGVSYRLETASRDIRFADDATGTAERFYFNIDREESKDLALNEGIIYIPAADINTIKVDGSPVDSLSLAVYNFDAAGNQIDEELKGSFDYANAANIKQGDILCVYKGALPENADMSSTLYDDIAYVKVTAVNGTTVSFTNAEPEDVLAVAKTALVKESEAGAITETDAGFSFSSDTIEFFSLALGDDTGVKRPLEVGDTLIIYEGDDFFMIDSAEKLVLGRVTAISDNAPYTITCKSVTAKELEGSINYHQVSKVDAAELIDKGYIKEDEIIKDIELQALESGIIEELANQYALLALETDLLEDEDFADTQGLAVLMDDGSLADAEQLRAAAEDTVQLQGVKVEKPTIKAEIKNKGGKYGNGSLVATLTINFKINIENANKDKIVVTFTILFTQEVYLGVGADAGISWHKIWGIPVWPKDVWISAYLDTKTYSSVELKATANTTLAEPEKIKDPDTGDEKEVTEKSLDIASKINDIMDSEEREAYDGVSGIYKTYQDFMATDWTYVELVRANLMKVPIKLAAGLVKMDIEIDFVLSGALNVSVSCKLEYQDGVRYSLNVRLSGPSVTFTQTQIVDRKLTFNASFVGRLGLKAGIELSLKMGFISTKLNSIGVSVQVGLYLEWMGFFNYKFEKNFSSGASSSVAQGAMYIEIGAYLDANAEAQAGNGKWKLTIDLLSLQFPLISTESKNYVYGFSLKLDEGEKLIINDKVNALPSNTLKMIELDLKNGKSYIADYTNSKDRFNISFADSRFSLSEDNKILVNAGTRDYLTTTMTISWKGSPLAFTTKPVTLKIPIVYTKDGELAEKGLLTVVDQDDTLIWEERVVYGKNIADSLPTQERILELLGYENFDATVDGQTVNLKYVNKGGYTTVPSGVVNGDAEFVYKIEKKTYTVAVEGVQKANGDTETRNFTAEYGKRFDFSALQNTFTEIPGKAYTVFSKIQTQKDKIADGLSIQDTLTNELAKQILEGKHKYVALYDDDSVTLTYNFITAFPNEIESKTEIIRKGSKTAFDFDDYVSANTDYVVSSADMALGTVVTSSRTVQVICKSNSDYKLVFELNGGDFVDSYIPPSIYRPVSGTALPTEENVELEGKIFIGWFLDPNFYDDPVETAIGDNGEMTFYAMWREPFYTLIYASDGFLGVQRINDVPYYDEITLINPTNLNHPKDTYLESGAQIGWNTERDGSGTAYELEGTMLMPKVNKYGEVIIHSQWTRPDIVEYQASEEEPFEKMKMGAAMTLAEQNGGGTIRLLNDIETKKTFVLPDGLIFDGGSTADKEIEVKGRFDVPLFNVAEGSSAVIKNLTISFAMEKITTAVTNSGTLRVENVHVDHPATTAFRNNGTGKMSLNNVSVENSVVAVSNAGTVIIDSCSFSNIKTTAESKAVVNSYPENNSRPITIINNTTILNSTRTGADGYGIGVYSVTGDLYILNSTIAGNIGSEAVCAHNYNDPSFKSYIINSVFASNTFVNGQITYPFTATDYAYQIFNSFAPNENSDTAKYVGSSIDSSFDYQENTSGKIFGTAGQIGITAAGTGMRKYLKVPTYVNTPTKLTQIPPTWIYLDYSDLGSIRLGYGPNDSSITPLIGAPTAADQVTEFIGGGERTSTNNRVGASFFS